MNDYNLFVYSWIAIGIISFPFILKYNAPYGRHTSNNWGYLIDNKLGNLLGELNWDIQSTEQHNTFSSMFEFE